MDTSFACEALLLPSRQFLPFPLLLAKGFHENIVCLFKHFFFFFLGRLPVSRLPTYNIGHAQLAVKKYGDSQT